MFSKPDAKVARFEGVPLFRGCSAQDKATVCRLGDLLRLEQGSVLVAQGRIGHETMILLEGSLTVTRDGRAVATLEPGAVVGEQAVLDGGRRTATVEATTPVELLVFDQRSFLALLTEVPIVTLRMLAETSRRGRRPDAAAAV